MIILLFRLVLMSAAGAGLLWWLAGRLSRDRRLGLIVTASFALRALLGVALFLISYHRWPVLEALQLGNGFWLFGPDSLGYDLYGSRILDALHVGIELPNPGTGTEYYLFVAGVYGLFGRHPLCGIFVNGWLGAASALLAYRIGDKLCDRRAALTGALLVAFWPSSLLWSAQLLKDSVGIFLVLCTFWLVLAIIPTEPDERRFRLVHWLGGCVLLGGCLVFLTRLRFYLGALFMASAIIGLGASAVLARLRGRGRHSAFCAGLLAVIVLSILLAREINSWGFLSPHHPEQGHVRLALDARAKDNLPGEVAEYRKALRLNPSSPEAYFGLVRVMLRAGAVPEAGAALAVSLEQTSDAPRRATIHRLIEDLLLLQPRVSELAEQDEKSLQVPLALIEEMDRLAGAGAKSAVPRAVESPSPPRLVASGEQPAALASEAAWAPVASVAPQDPAVASAAAPAVRGRAQEQIKELGTRVSTLDDHALGIVRDMTPQALGQFREGFVSTGGHSLMDAWAQISHPKKLFTYLPRALAIGLLAPFPWQWFDLAGSTGVMRLFASLEMLLIYLLVPAMLVGMVRLVRRSDGAGWFLATFILLAASSMSLVVANLGTLFRLRLQFLLPLLIVAAYGEPRRLLLRLASLFRGGGRRRAAVEAEQARGALAAPHAEQV